ncbi:MAG: ribonuclease P protein subunit [Candidatus Diapherotrites archaeon]
MEDGKKNIATRRNLPAHELIGLNARVEECSDRGMLGAEGRVVDETKNLVVIETRKGDKKIPKKDAVFEFECADGIARVRGSELLARPEDRVKLFCRKRR